MLLRDTFAGPHPPLLKDLILAVAPIYNADGNERVSKTNRPGQVGPEEGMGQRHQRPRPRPQPRLRQARGPRDPRPGQVPQRVEPSPVHRHPHHQRLVPPLHDHLRRAQEPGRRPQGHRLHAPDLLPRGHQELREADRPEGVLLRELRAGDHTKWTTYPAEARYGTTYAGLRNRLSVLSEAYAYAPYKTRVLATRDFVLDCLELAAGRKAEIVRLLDAAAAARPSRPHPAPVPIRSRVKAAGQPATVLGYEEKPRREQPAHQDRDDEGLRGPARQRVRGGRVGHASVRLPGPAGVPRGGGDPPAARPERRGAARGHRARRWRSTRSTPSRSRRGGSRATRPSSCSVTPRRRPGWCPPARWW